MMYRTCDIKIYQIDSTNKDNVSYRFTPLRWLKRGKEDVDINRYKKVYHIKTVMEDKKDSVILEDIFRKFNIGRPKDFKGHSLSVSDIVELDGDKYYCDSFGFVKL